MNVILISPYSFAFSFGIRTLSSCLKNEGHNVKIIFLPQDFLIRYEQKVLDEVEELSSEANLIGLSLMTHHFENAVQITRTLKRTLHVPILWGGIHPTIRPRECLDNADMVCIGEGEGTIIELARRMEEGRNFDAVEGLWLNYEGKIVANKLRPLIQDLNRIPFPDYDYRNHYILDSNRIERMSTELLSKYNLGNYVTMPTRGCPFGCSYCCNNALNKMYANQKAFRKRSIDNIIEELNQVKKNMPTLQRIYFDDDAFFLYKLEEIIDFSKRYRETIQLPFVITGATPSTLTKEKLSPLVDAGLTFIRMGIETGSERTKSLYKRNYSNEQVLSASRVLNEFRDKIGPPQYDIILDNPWETDEDLVNTLMFLTGLPAPYKIRPFSLTLYPATELYEKAKKDGIITDDIEDVYRKDYLWCRHSYLNKLFFLLMESEGRLSKRVMRLLTNKTIQRLRLNWLLYRIVMAKLKHFPSHYS